MFAVIYEASGRLLLIPGGFWLIAVSSWTFLVAGHSWRQHEVMVAHHHTRSPQGEKF